MEMKVLTCLFQSPRVFWKCLGGCQAQRVSARLLTVRIQSWADKTSALLLEVQSVLRRIAEGIESIPLHLSLPIIRLDDALGVSWALPFQACTEYPVSRPVRHAKTRERSADPVRHSGTCCKA